MEGDFFRGWAEEGTSWSRSGPLEQRVGHAAAADLLAAAAAEAGNASTLRCAALTVGRVLCTVWWLIASSSLHGLLDSSSLLHRLVVPPRCAALLSLLGASSAQVGGASTHRCIARFLPRWGRGRN